MPAARSKLVPLGLALMIMGVAFPRALAFLADGLQPGPVRRMVTMASGVLLGGFILGLVLGIIGIVKNRRALRN